MAKNGDQKLAIDRWGPFGGIAVAMSDEKQGTKAWATGVIGEERLGARLDSLASEDIAVLHDQRISGLNSSQESAASRARMVQRSS